MFPDVQSAVVVVHEVLHASVPHWYGAHELVVADRHVPLPSHERGDDNVDPMQLAAPQVVPAGYMRHAPFPLHLPSAPHDVGPMSVHWLVDIGDVPAGIGEHVPPVPVRLHDTQAAAQPVLQHTPCSQYPDAHSAAAEHGTLFAFLLQIVPLQTNPLAQSAFELHFVRHPEPPHT
jgi:hypothetical protein